jgi:hypothetical protein
MCLHILEVLVDRASQLVHAPTSNTIFLVQTVPQAVSTMEGVR